MKPKSVVLVLVAVGCGLVAAFLTTMLAAKSGDPTEEWPVADKDIRQGDKINFDTQFRMNKIPKGAVPFGALRNKKDIDGKVLVKSLKKDQLVFETDLGDNETILKKLEPGEVAYTVPVRVDTAVAGFILPDSRVDLVCVYPEKDKQMAGTFLQNVRVLAMNAETTKSETGGANPNPATVTLAVKPGDAQKVALAKVQGQITLTLRRHADDKIKFKGVPISSIMAKDTATEGPEAAKTVKVIVATKQINAGTKIEDPTALFTTKDMLEDDAPKNAYGDSLETLKDKVVERDIDGSQVLTTFYLSKGKGPDPVIIAKAPKVHVMTIQNGRLEPIRHTYGLVDGREQTPEGTKTPGGVGSEGK